MGIYYVRRTKMKCFECNYGEVGKRRSCVLGFPKDFVFVRTIMLLLFFTKSFCHSLLFCKERVISVSYSRLPQSHNKNTEQDTLPCSGKLQLSLFLAAFGLISWTIQPVFIFKKVSTWKTEFTNGYTFLAFFKKKIN